MNHTPISWINGKDLYSRAYEDIYFNTQNGLDESNYVFIQGNDISNRFNNSNLQRFSLLELGFGTGLNFLATLSHWQNHQHKHQGWLDYVAIEKFPLTPDDIKKALGVFPTIAAQLSLFLHHYQKVPHTVTEYWLDQRVRLTLFPSDVKLALATICDNWATLDAVYLDGFAPAKNPDMWDAEHYRQIAKISGAQTSLATFTAAGFVRRAIQASGFKVRKVKGYGHKREMIAGQFEAEQPAKPKHRPWFAPAPQQNPSHIVIIGGGIAGLSTAHQLIKETKARVTLIEQHDIASGASGNPAALAYPQFDRSLSNTCIWSLNAFKQAQFFYNEVDPKCQFHQPIQLELIQSAKFSRERLHQLTQISALSEFIDYDGHRFLLSAIQLQPKALLSSLTQILLQSERFEMLAPRQFTNLSDAGSEIIIELTNGQSLRCSHAVFCNSFDLVEFFPWLKCDTDIKWGQVSSFKADLELGRSGQFYALPLDHQQCLVGASYHASAPDIRQRQHDTDQFRLFLGVTDKCHEVMQRVSSRMTTIDRFPLVGPLADIDFIEQNYQDLDKGFPDSRYPNCRYRANQFINIGYGSRGFSHAPWGANIIAKQIRLSQFDGYFNQLVHPNRLIIRNLRRGKPIILR